MGSHLLVVRDIRLWVKIDAFYKLSGHTSFNDFLVEDIIFPWMIDRTGSNINPEMRLLNMEQRMTRLETAYIMKPETHINGKPDVKELLTEHKLKTLTNTSLKEVATQLDINPDQGRKALIAQILEKEHA